jgi:hypothetical protein
MSEIPRPAAALKRVLHEAPVEVVSHSSHDPKWFPVTVKGPRWSEELTLLWAGEGWPSDVEAVLSKAPDPWAPEFVVAARHFSAGALRILRAHDANWVDESGGARIIGPSGMLVLNTRRQSLLASGGRPFAWTPSALAAGEAILARSNEPIFNSSLAELTGFSPSQVSRTLAQFDKLGWTRKLGTERGPGAQRTLEDGDGLLRSWSGDFAGEPRSEIQAHALFNDALDFLERDLAPTLEGLESWAVSGWAALELTAPFATQVPTLQIYVPELEFDTQLEKLLAKGPLRRVDDGGRVMFWPATATALRLRTVHNARMLPTVSAPRLYADLLSLGGRGADSAEHVREVLLEL